MSEADERERQQLAGAGLQPAGHARDGLPGAGEEDDANAPREAAEPEQNSTRPSSSSKIDDRSPTSDDTSVSDRSGAPAAVAPPEAREGGAGGGFPRKTIAAMVLAVIGVFFFGVPLGLIAIGLAFFGRRESVDGRPGQGLATAAMVVGVLGVVVFGLEIALR